MIKSIFCKYILPLLTTVFIIYFCTHNEIIGREIRI
nr:MAG TPA: hypothetical protein [Herelleviridae sp.]